MVGFSLGLVRAEPQLTRKGETMSTLPPHNSPTETSADGDSNIGRPTKLTPKARERILELIRAGNRRTVAARAAGVSDATFYRWMADDRPLYRKLRAAIEQAEAETEAALVEVVMQGIPSHPQLALKMLEARSGEWRRWKLPPEPEPKPVPLAATPKPGSMITITAEDMDAIAEWRWRMEYGEPSEEELAARKRLVVEVSNPR